MVAGENFGKFAMNYTTLNLKTTIVYFIITCSSKMVYAFVVTSVVRGYHKHKDVWSTPIDGAELPCEKEHGNPRDTSAVAVIE